MLHNDTAGLRSYLRTRIYPGVILFMILALLFVDLPVSYQVRIITYKTDNRYVLSEKQNAKHENIMDYPNLVSLQVIPQTTTVHAEPPLGDFGDIWASIELDDSHDLAWGDMDNDGDLDLAVANRSDVPGRIW